MPNEGSLWNYLRKNMAGSWDAQRHEDKYSAGIPDVSYAMDGHDGWLELKHALAWPKRSETLVRLKHPLSPIQKAWLVRRAATGGAACWVLVKIHQDHLLFHWSNLEGLVTPLWTKDTFIKESFAHWHPRLDFPGLRTILRAQVVITKNPRLL